MSEEKTPKTRFKPGFLQRRTVIAIVVLELLVGVIFTSAYLRARGQSRLETAFDHELRILLHMPVLKGRFRDVDLLTDLFLLTGAERYLNERGGIIREIDASLDGVEGLAQNNAQAKEAVADLRRRFRAQTLEQQHWIRKRESAPLGAAAYAQMASRHRDIREMLDSVSGLSFFSVKELEQRRLEARRSGMLTFWGLAALLALVCVAIFAYFSRRVVRPITLLSRRAGRWRIGRRWLRGFPPADEELTLLQRQIAAMSQRANRAYEKESELVELKSRMASMVSHEFNNSLSIISGIVALLGGDVGKLDDSKRQEYHTIIQAHVKSLAADSATILNMGRLEEGKFRLKFDKTDINALVKVTIERLRILSDRKEHALTLSLDAEIPLVKADGDTLSLVIGNLMTNAVKYTPKGGRLEISTRKTDAGARVTVKDSGIGIAPEDQEKIFSGFFRTEESKREARGFGLGLAFARRIVEDHGHPLELKSAKGEGSTLSFELDAWKETAHAVG